MMDSSTVKRPRKEGNKLTGCLCHGHSSNPGKLEKFTPVTWNRFCAAAKRREDSVYIKLREYINDEVGLPVPVTRLSKHHNCYTTYTSEKHIELSQQKETEASTRSEKTIADGSLEHSTSKKLTWSRVPKTDLRKCLLCQKDKVLHGNRGKLEDIHSLSLDQAVDTLRAAAKVRRDERILLQLSTDAREGADAIVGDIMVHRSCHSSYTHKRSLHFIQSGSFTESAENDAFTHLSNEIEKGIINGHEVWQMADMRDRFVEHLLGLGADCPEYRVTGICSQEVNHQQIWDKSLLFASSTSK